jgi:hypothetical protein
MPSLEALRASPHYPVLMTPDPARDHITYNGGDDRTSPLPINGGMFDWENDSFKARQAAARGVAGAGRGCCVGGRGHACTGG